MSHCVGTHNGQERIAARRQVWQGPAQNIEHWTLLLFPRMSSSFQHANCFVSYCRAQLLCPGQSLSIKCQCFDTRRPPDWGPHPGVQLPGRNPSLRHRQPRRQAQATHRSDRDKRTFTSWFPHTQHFGFLKRVTNNLSPSAKFWVEIKRPKDFVDSENCHDFSGICVSPLGDRYAYIVDIGADCVRKFRYK